MCRGEPVDADRSTGYDGDMNDLFTADDRNKINAAMLAGSNKRFDELLAERPKPSFWWHLLGWVIWLPLFLIGAIVTGSSPIAGIAILIVTLALGVLVTRWFARWMHRRKLRTQARLEVVGGYATDRGWTMVDSIPLGATTPLLREGDRRSTGWGVMGELGEGTRFCAGYYLYEVRERSTDSDGNTTETWQQHPYTIALIDAALPDLKQLSIHKGKTGGILSKLGGAVSSLRPVPLESEEFNKAFQLMVADDAEELAIRSRFTPSIQVAFIDRGAGTSRAEAENSVLMVARTGQPRTDDFGTLMDILGDALWLRAVLTDTPPGRLPDVPSLRKILIGDEA